MLIKNKKNLLIYSAHTSNNKALSPHLLDRYILGVENQIIIRESFDYKDRYEVYITRRGDKLKYLYNYPTAIATSILKQADKFNIELK